MGWWICVEIIHSSIRVFHIGNSEFTEVKEFMELGEFGVPKIGLLQGERAGSMMTSKLPTVSSSARYGI